MTPKIIMVPFSGRDNELGALETAAELAKKWQAHMQVWHIAPRPHSSAAAVYSMYGSGLTYIPDSLLLGIEKNAKASIGRATKKYHRFLRIMQIPDCEGKAEEDCTASFHIAEGPADIILRVRARLADLVVISRGYTEEPLIPDSIVSDIAFESGRPVLLVPAGRHGRSVGKKPVIAWNGGREAARAVTSAMPFLKDAESVLMVSELGGDAGKTSLSAHELGGYLKRHGVAAKAVISRDKAGSAGQRIHARARKHHADLIVMGAYGRSRVRETILGGVTEYMLKKSTIPVLFTH